MPKPPLAHYLQNPKLNNFNLLRLIAAIAVVFGHSFALSLNAAGRMEPVQRLLKFGYSGSIAVDVFFLISGIFVSQSLYFERNFFSFLTKRFLRIWPGLVICLAVTAALAITVSQGAHSELFGTPATYAYILKNSILKLQWGIADVFAGRKYTAINGSLWTLPLEVKMYICVLFFGVFGFLYSRSLLLVFSTLFAVLLLMFPDRFIGFFNSHDKESLVPVIFFFAGMAAFAIRGSLNVRVPHILCVLVLAALVGASTFEVICYVLIGMLTIWFGCSEFIGRLPKFRGDYSYGIYIYGFPIQQIVATWWPGTGPYEMFGVTMVIVMSCAVLSWHLVELPAQIVGKEAAHLFSGKLQPNRNVLTVIRQNWRGVALPVLITGVTILGYGASTFQLDRTEVATLDTQIIAFGPTPIVHAQPFNQQPDGQSAIWVKLDRPAAQDFILVLGGEKLTTVVSGDLLTAFVPPKLFSNPGSPKLFVEAIRHAHKTQSVAVNFEVR